MIGLPKGPYFSVREDGGPEGRFVVVATCPPGWMNIPLGHRYQPTSNVFEAIDFAEQMNYLSSSVIDDFSTTSL
jgi:hypothetical protein